MGGGHHDHELHHPNMNNIQESDGEMPSKIRSIDLIKFNPNMFYKSFTDASAYYEILGGFKWAVCAAAGTGLSW